MNIPLFAKNSLRDAPIPKVKKEAKNPYKNKVKPHFRKLGGSINPYTGSFGFSEKKHLLYRTLFGFSPQNIAALDSKNVSESLDVLLKYQSPAEGPVNNYYNIATDPNHAPGETWVNGPRADTEINILQTRSFQSWTFGQMLNQELSIQEKMTLFWHNHFATQASTIFDSKLIYRHHKLLRENCLGNFKDLVKKVTLDAGMLFYLNGYLNQKNKPDENYARELQELFTLGVGTGYTEMDVREAARILTGWTIDPISLDVSFVANRHDTGNKQFSAFYNNTFIAGNAIGEVELDALIDMIFAKTEVAEFLCRKLYRFFVYYHIDARIENDIIQPLAQTFRDNNYEIEPVLRQLFSSEHFYDVYARGAMIKNPLDYYAGMHKILGTSFDFSGDVAKLYSAWEYIALFSAVSQMEIANPPNVAGWEAYWNSPAYHELWINSVTLPFRNQLADAVIFPEALRYQGANIYANILTLTEGISQAEDPNVLVDYVVNYFLPQNIEDEQKAQLKSLLLSGQDQDFYWTVSWLDYLDDKSNESKQQIVFFRLFAFYKQAMNLAEFQLS